MRNNQRGSTGTSLLGEVYLLPLLPLRERGERHGQRRRLVLLRPLLLLRCLLLLLPLLLKLLLSLLRLLVLLFMPCSLLLQLLLLLMLMQPLYWRYL